MRVPVPFRTCTPWIAGFPNWATIVTLGWPAMAAIIGYRSCDPDSNIMPLVDICTFAGNVILVGIYPSLKHALKEGGKVTLITHATLILPCPVCVCLYGLFFI